MTTYETSPVTDAAIRKFRTRHRHKDAPRPQVATPCSNISVSFTDSSIGTHVQVRCDICGKDKDVTDYDTW